MPVYDGQKLRPIFRAFQTNIRVNKFLRNECFSYQFNGFHVSPQPFSRSREYGRKHYTLPQSQQNPNGTTKGNRAKCPIYGAFAVVTGKDGETLDFDVSTMWYNICTKKYGLFYHAFPKMKIYGETGG